MRDVAMLRSIRVFNFVHFLQPQTVEFCDGANFIIGENSTGKSAILELVRRCLSNSSSTTTTTVANEKEIAYAVCSFHMPADSENNQKTDAFASLFVKNIGTITDKDKPFDIYKIIGQISTEKEEYFYVLHYNGFYGCSARELKEQSCKRINSKYLTKHINNIITSDKKDQVIDFFEYMTGSETFSKLEKCSGENANDLFKSLENGYIAVLPMRSIGPLQWTKSKKNNHEDMENNYQTACDRAEIITDLLDSDKIDKNVEDRYDRNLIFPYEFKKTHGIITVQNRNKSNSPPKPLLKTPEGIIEAKQISLILAHTEFQTITYEEPDRGMHPHMIRKMRDLVLRDIKGKTVVVVSHNPAITNQWTMERTYVCSKTTTESGEICHFIRKVPRGFNRYGRLEEMNSLLFSSRILFVEGLIDKIILGAIFSLLINDANIIKDKNVSPELIHFLLGMDILELSSASEGNKKKEFCNDLHKENYIIYDADVFKDTTPLTQDTSNDTKSTRTIGKQNHIGWRINGKHKGVMFKETFLNENEFKKKENFSAFEKKCGKANIFCWKNGAIEYRIIDVLDGIDVKNPIMDIVTKIVCLKDEETVLKLERSDDSKKEEKLQNARSIERKRKESCQLYKTTDGKIKADHKRTIVGGLKGSISQADQADIEELGKAMIEYSSEIDRLITFLKCKIGNDINAEKHNRKRRSPAESNSFDLRPRKKSKEEEHMDGDSDMVNDEPEQTHAGQSHEMETFEPVQPHTGQTQNMLDLDLDLE